MHTKKVLQEEEGYSTPTTLCVQISKVFRTQWGGICTQNRKEGGNDIGVCGSWIQNGNGPCLYVQCDATLADYEPQRANICTARQLNRNNAGSGSWISTKNLHTAIAFSA